MLKQELARELVKKSSLRNWFNTLFGPNDDKLIIRRPPKIEEDQGDINVFKSSHTKEVQCSKYIKIDDAAPNNDDPVS